MTNLEKLRHTQEFTQTYEQTKDFTLPESLSDYRLVSCLSDGEFKKTWVLLKPDGQTVLCKYASGEYADMLRTESEFFHPGKFPFVPRIYDYLETSDGAYLLREYIEGQTLYELVEKEGPLPLKRAVPLMEQLCEHLICFHTSVPPIIYRDLKPSNIVLQDSGDCYLIDLGTVRTYHEDDSADTVFIGTANTAAPEQFGARQTDARTDIYGLGILFYYLLTGELKIQESRLKELPYKAARIIRKCTAFDPDNRYPDVTKVVNTLHNLVHVNIRRVIASAAVLAAIALTVFLIIPAYVESRKVVFTDALLEQAVRSSLDKPEGEPVYNKDLELITHLYVCGSEVYADPEEHSQFEAWHSVRDIVHDYGDITDISLLQKMPNLHTVVLDYQQIEDISALKDLELTSLSLCGNPIRDLSTLRNQTSLAELYLSEAAVSSLEPLRGCRFLSKLDCSFTPVSSLEPVSSLPIRILHLKSTPIEDLENLPSMSLEELSLSNVSSEKFAQFENFPALDHLTLEYCNIKSLEEVSAFSNVFLLNLSNNMLADLSGIEQFTNLHYLLLDENPITDYTPVTKAVNVEYMNIPTSVMDFTFLNEMPQVQYIRIRGPQLPALYEAVPEPWFTVDVY